MPSTEDQRFNIFSLCQPITVMSVISFDEYMLQRSEYAVHVLAI